MLVPALVLALPIQGLPAQDPGSETQGLASEGDFSEPAWSFAVAPVFHHYLESDLDGGTGDLSASRIGLRLQAARPWGTKRRAGFELRFEEANFHFGGGAAIGGFTDPFGELFLTTLSSSLSTRESEDLSWLATLYARMGWESGADQGEAITFGGGIMTSIRLNSKFLLTVGGFGNTRLEDDPLVYPWLQLDWSPTDRLHVGQTAGGYGVGYDWMQNLSAFFNISFVERQYRLADDGLLPDGVARDDEFALNLGLIWERDESFEAQFFGGLAFRDLTLLANDQELGDATIEPAPYLGFQLRYRL